MVYVNLYHHLGPAYYTFISPNMLCRSALKNFIFYAQEQELWPDYYAIYTQVCMNIYYI